MQNLVTVIIPTYNRFNFLLNAIESVNNQLKKYIKIIIINDGSTQKEYYDYNFQNHIFKIDIKVNQTKLKSYSSDAIRNIGIKLVDTKYVAFLDDDDYWLDNKISSQVQMMEDKKFNISSTEGLAGRGAFDKSKLNSYPLYFQDYFYKTIANKYQLTKFYKSSKIYNKKFVFPNIFNKEFLDIHNCIATSSVVVKTDTIKKVGMFDERLPNGIGDYDCWKKILKIENNLFISKPYFYYDLNHGEGRNYI